MANQSHKEKESGKKTGFSQKTLFFFFLLILNIEFAFAANSLGVEKIIGGKEINVGDEVKILLKFANPFGKEIAVKIVDNNIFGNNGLNVQCLEYTLPADKETTLAYEPIKPFKAGNYELLQAQVSYTNPETGKDEKISSNGIKVSVKESAVPQGQAEGVTTIYRCGGVSMQSTSYSSSGFNVQMSSSGAQQSGEENQQDKNVQQRMENNQLNQNTNQLKQELLNNAEEQKKLQDEFRQNIARNQQFQKEHKGLLNEGYNISDASLNPSTENSGSFELSYRKENGETALVKGVLENNTMKELMKQSSKNREEMLKMLQQNEKFKKYDKELVDNGFNQSQPLFSQMQQNYTKISLPYKKGDLEKQIGAEFINGTIQNVTSDMQNEKASFNWRLLLVFFILASLLLAGWILYKKYKPKIKKEIHKSAAQKPQEEIDYLKESRMMLAEAEELFRNGHEKDAYEKVSRAVRFYFSHKMELKKDVMGFELVRLLKEKKHDPSKVKKCLDMCSMVEFARYKATKEDFLEIIGLGRELIK